MELIITNNPLKTCQWQPITDKIEGASFQFVNDWFCVSSDVSATKCDDKVYFNGMISNASTQMEHESLPPGTMFIMPTDWRPSQRTIYDLKEDKANYNVYMDPFMEIDLSGKTDKIEILPDGQVNLIGGATGWFLNLTGCWYSTT